MNCVRIQISSEVHIMTARGHVQNGVIVLEQPADLPVGAEVAVNVLSEDSPMPPPMARLTAVEKKEYGELHPWVQRMIGILPEDLDWNRERDAHLQEKY